MKLNHIRWSCWRCTSTLLRAKSGHLSYKRTSDCGLHMIQNEVSSSQAIGKAITLVDILTSQLSFLRMGLCRGESATSTIVVAFVTTSKNRRKTSGSPIKHTCSSPPFWSPTKAEEPRGKPQQANGHFIAIQSTLYSSIATGIPRHSQHVSPHCTWKAPWAECHWVPPCPSR